MSATSTTYNYIAARAVDSQTVTPFARVTVEMMDNANELIAKIFWQAMENSARLSEAVNIKAGELLFLHENAKGSLTALHGPIRTGAHYIHFSWGDDAQISRNLREPLTKFLAEQIQTYFPITSPCEPGPSSHYASFHREAKESDYGEYE